MFSFLLCTSHSVTRALPRVELGEAKIGASYLLWPLRVTTNAPNLEGADQIAELLLVLRRQGLELLHRALRLVEVLPDEYEVGLLVHGGNPFR